MDKDAATGAGAEAEDRFDAVEIHFLLLFPELVEELGGDVRALLAEIGLDAAAFLSGQQRGTYRQTVELLELSARRLGVQDFGLRLGTLQAGQISSPLVQAMKHSPSFGEALKFVTSHSYVHSRAALIWMRPTGSEGDVLLGHDILLDGLPHRTQAVEQILLVAHHAAMEATGGLVRARRIDFRHQPVSPLRTYRHIFGCEVRFGQAADCLLFRAGDLTVPTLSPDADAHAEVAAFIDAQYPQRRRPFHARVRGILMHLIGAEGCTNDRVAAALNLHGRTLHRRLQEEGTSFQQIKNEVRRDMMLYYLQRTDIDLSHVSERVGFAEQSAMTRYCRKCFDLSPTQLRAEARRRS
ncbi:MAG TPA: AraC family transcriptional regulator ligand-binding domain-containing protein [Sphingobium sp.]|uniref:AraC family transcriptional regulator n=1 Tax=Sphingobium sp. TaxID=1912891 RepID=UPI002ED2DE72